MVRAFTVCAVILAACTATAQTVAPKISSQPEPDEKLGIEIPDASVAAAETDFDKHALLKQKLAEMNCLQSEIDELRVATGTLQQILVKIKAVEVSRTKLRKLGTDIAALRGDNRANSSFEAPTTAPASALAVGFRMTDDTAAVNGLIEQLRKNNVAKVLAEPKLVAVSGRPASLKVGGEIPLPALPGSDQAVEFKPFGTQVDVMAVALGDNRVRLELLLKVSEVDDSRQIQIAGVTVPSVSVRQIDTAVDLRFGQMAVFSGLLQKRTEQHMLENKVVDDVNEIEVFFLVTPELITSKDVPQHASKAIDSATYRTATSGSEERPRERSLRVTPNTPR